MDKYVIFHIDGGAGKSVAATAVCSSIKAAYPEHKLIVVTAWPEVFLHNPEVFRVYKMGNFAYFYDDFIKNKETIILRNEPYHASSFLKREKHLTETWCEVFEIPCITKEPKLFLTQRELIHAAKLLQKQGPILLFNISGGADEKEYYSWARDLPVGFATQLAKESQSKFSKILQIRKDNQPAIEGAIQVTDHLRNLFCYVYFADKLVLIDSLTQHIAAALKKPAAVAWIANSPNVFGYPIHTNIGPSQQPRFRHNIDSYLEEYDWVGRRHYECPFDDAENMFDKKPFMDYIFSSELTFDKMPTNKKL
jgi:hypothetical protein